jgi:hypothetical protein
MIVPFKRGFTNDDRALFEHLFFPHLLPRFRTMAEHRRQPFILVNTLNGISDM